VVRVYTRQGDDGTTGLADGSRVPKDAVRVWAYGEVDELNAVVGLLRAEAPPADVDQQLARVQSCLFTLGAVLADPGERFAVDEEALHPNWLESWIDIMEAELPPLRNFVLPGGHRPAALSHLARTTCRRAERRVVALQAGGGGPRLARAVPFLNRLSDAFFVLARLFNWRAGVADVVWRGRP